MQPSPLLPSSLLLLFLTPLALTTPTTPQKTQQTTTTSPPYIGLSVHFGTLAAPCSDPNPSLTFNLKPPTSWLSQPPTSHCLPGVPGDIHNITCVTRRLSPLPADTALDTTVGDMGSCDFWGYTEQNCAGKYWVAGRGNDAGGSGSAGAGADAGGPGQSWVWTDEEREAGPELLDIRSWRIDCGV